MKRVVIFSILVLLVIGTIGCGPEVKTETIYADKAPSVSVSTPTTTWTSGDIKAIQWSTDTNPKYNLGYSISFYLVPSEDTEVNAECWDNEPCLNNQTGRYYFWGLWTNELEDGDKTSHETVPNLPAGEYKLQIELAHYESSTSRITILAVNKSDYFNILPDATPAPLVTARTTFVSATTATISGKVKTNGAETTVWVEYGKMAWDQNTDPIIINAASSPTDVTISIENLEPATEYYYRVVAQNSYGIVYSYFRCFKTQ